MSISMAVLFDVVNGARWRATRQSERENTILRAFTGAGMLTGQVIRAASVREAACSVSVCPGYIAAARIVLATEDEVLVREVLRGCLPLMTAAHQARTREKLIRGFQNATSADLKAFADTVGVANLFDTVIAPQL